MSEELNTVKSGHFSGKVAIATNDGERVTGHLGRCRSFMIIELNNETIVNKELRDNVFTHHRMHEENHNHSEGGGHSHTNLINGLKDCSFLISSGGGWRIVEDLKQNNITPIFSDVEMIDDAIAKFVKGELKDDAGLICRHD